LSKENKRIHISNVKDVAAERDFYTVDKLEDKHMWEKHYSHNVEPLLSK